MDEEILKTRDVRINLDKNLTFESIFEKYASDKIKIRIIPQSLNDNEPMEVNIREIREPHSFEGKTGTYIPPQKEEETKGKKKSIIKKISDSIIP